MTNIRRVTPHIALFIVLIIVGVTIAYAWGSTGHRIINRKAAMHLPSIMSSFKADSLFYESHASDADYRRDNNDTTFNAEQWRHYIDIDDYPNFHSIPRDLDTLISIYGYGRVKRNGLNPWITAWLVDSLTAQIRRGALTTAKYTMSDLGHYVADVHQPLHCTENYDGQYTGNNGIHSRYESSMINAYSFYISVHKDSVQYVTSPRDFAFEYIYHSNSLIDSIFAADDYAKAVSSWNGSGTPPSSYYSALWQKCQYFTIDQFQRATFDLASLWYTAWVNAGLITDVHESLKNMPNGFELFQNYPNPFNPVTFISYQLPVVERSGTSLYRVRLEIFDVLGRRTATLVDEMQEAGYKSVEWDASRHVGTSGVYFYTLTAGQNTDTKKLILLK